MKKSIVCILLSTLQVYNYASTNFGLNPQDVKELGKEFAKGLLEGLPSNGAKGIGKDLIAGALDNFNQKESENLTRNALTGSISGVSSALESSEVDILTKKAAKNVGKVASNFIEELDTNLDDTLKIASKKIGDKFKEGSEIDKSIKSARRFIEGHYDDFMNKNLHKHLAKAVFAIFGTYFLAKYGIPFTFDMLKNALATRPKLITESSKKSIVQKIASFFTSRPPATPMIFEPKLEARLNKLVKTTKVIQKKIKEGKKNIKYRNLMLYGPPGTGKTLFATELAKRSGLEYAFMSGSSFFKFKGGEGIEALDELFAWANKSNGLMIFIDEAEAFLSKRENMDPLSPAYQLLNNFLNYTGTGSNKFMLVFATNHKDALDSAMYRRINDLIKMPLPGYDERVRILTLYKNKILMDAKQNGHKFVNSVGTVLTAKVIKEIAQATEGFSGGDLAGLINIIKTDSDSEESSLLTKEVVDAALSQAIEKYNAFMENEYAEGSIEKAIEKTLFPTFSDVAKKV